MSSGSFRKFGAESYGMSGTACWAATKPPAMHVPATIARTFNARFMDASVELIVVLPRRRRRAPPVERELLHAPRGDFRHEQIAVALAVHRVHGPELAQLLAGPAELAEDRAVELHLVDLAGHRGDVRVVVVRVRVGAVEILMRPWR